MTREEILGFRVRAQQLDRDPGGGARRLADTAILAIGAQDTGPDGGLWALAIRGVDVSKLAGTKAAGSELSTVWTLRGAPHIYRRADLPEVAAAVAPFSDADAGKRIFDASKPLREAGISNLQALDAVAAAMRSIVTHPMVKGEVSTRLTSVMDPAYLRSCRPCNATHIYEMPFRLAALRGGLELQAGTSPPVLQRIPGFRPSGAGPLPEPRAAFDVIRCYLKLLGPATAKQVAEYIDAPVKEIKARWPSDAVEVDTSGDGVPGGGRKLPEPRWVLAEDEERLTEGPTSTTRLLGPYDLYLQTKDRSMLVADVAQAKTLWPVLGRPGAVLHDGDIAGTWRPRASGAKLSLQVELWVKASPAVRRGVTEQAERLASHRRLRLAGLDIAA